MQFAKTLVIAALFGLATMEMNEVNALQLSSSIQINDFNGADEDEIMDKVFSKYSTEGKDHNGVKNGVKILMKSTAPKAAGVILEATHKLKGNQVPGYMKANFEKAWEKFDINGDGFIKAEETHTFMRSLMGKLNKFALAPGSLSDIGAATGGASKAAAAPVAEKKVVVAKAPPKKVEVEAEAENAEAPAATEDAATPTTDDAAAVELAE
jgi:hypothetical protein